MSSQFTAVTLILTVFLLSSGVFSQAHAQPAAASAVKLRVQIAAKCTPEAAMFRVLNKGQKWPETGVISVYDLDLDKLISKRRLRLSDGQQASFRIRNQGEARNLGVFVAPGWFERPFRYDAKLSCG